MGGLIWAGHDQGALTAQALILVIAMGTGAKAITHLAGGDAAPLVVTQETCPVGRCHTGLGPCVGRGRPQSQGGARKGSTWAGTKPHPSST